MFTESVGQTLSFSSKFVLVMVINPSWTEIYRPPHALREFIFDEKRKLKLAIDSFTDSCEDVCPRDRYPLPTNNSSRVARPELHTRVYIARLQLHCSTIIPWIVAIELLTYWFVRAECSTADEPGQVARIGGLSNFGKVSGEEGEQKKGPSLSLPRPRIL